MRKSRSNVAMTDEQGKVFCEELKRLRKESGATSGEFSELVGVSQSYYSKLECGHKLPSPQLAEKIAQLFNLTVSEMLIPHDERVWEIRKKYGNVLKTKREEKGLPLAVVAGALNIPPSVYKEYEQGLCSITDREVEMLDKLLGISEKPKVVERKVVVEVPVEVPTKVCDIILEHIRDLQISEDEQRNLWRYFSKAKLDADERRLFGYKER